MNRKSYSSSKRRHANLKHEEEESIDDLAVAASFAMQPLPHVPNMDEDNGSISVSSASSSDSDNHGENDNVNKIQHKVIEKIDVNVDVHKVSLKSEAEASNVVALPEKGDRDNLINSSKKKSNIHVGENRLDAKEHIQSNEETKDVNGKLQTKDAESDDESDVDLSESLAKMEDELDDKIIGSKKGVEQGPKSSLKTEHELDINTCSLEDLGKQLDLDLRVDEEKEKERLKENVHLVVAGQVKSHLIDERILVVESNCGGFTNRDALDEGCLLVMKVDESMLESKIPETSQNKSVLIPVAKICEVFGPVVKPLYTLRLPSKESYKKHKEKSENGDSMNQSNKNNTEETNRPVRDGEKGANTAEDLSSNISVNAETISTKEIVNDNISYDPWSKTGIYTQLLYKNRNMQMYFDQSNIKKINTEAIIRTSGKGSDASNIYDEEVVNVNEIDYSDDEAEREAKQRKKKSNKNRMHDKGNNATRNNHFKNRGGNRVFHKFSNNTNVRDSEKFHGTTNFHNQPAHFQNQNNIIAGQYPNMAGGQQQNWANYQNAFPQNNIYPQTQNIPHQPPMQNIPYQPPMQNISHQPPNYNSTTIPVNGAYLPHQNQHPNITTQQYVHNQSTYSMYNQNINYQNQVHSVQSVQTNTANNQNDSDTVYYNYTE